MVNHKVLRPAICRRSLTTSSCKMATSSNIAQGTYKPHATVREISFQITNKNVSLKGGWIVGTPWTHSGNPALTILSGNINNTGIATDNSYTVLKLSHSGATNSGTLIEYLTITGGFANDGAGQDSGGGVRITNGAAPRLHQCRIANNFAGTLGNTTSGGPGVYVNASSPVLTRCTIESNSMVLAPPPSPHTRGRLTPSLKVQACKKMFHVNVSHS